MKKPVIFLICLLLALNVFSQGGGRMPYKLELETRKIMGGEGDAGYSSIQLSQQLFNLKFKNGQKGIFSSRFTYTYSNLHFNETALKFDDLEKFHTIGLNLSYVRRINARWSFLGMCMPQLKSNFSSALQGDDFYINAFALFNYAKNRDPKFTVGLAYISTLGFPAPIPIFMYWVNLNIKWKIAIGFPRLSATYSINKKSRLDLYLEMAGMNANISNPLTHPDFIDNKEAQKISYRDIISGAEYIYTLKNVQLFFNIGYSLNRNMELQDADYKKVYSYDVKNNFNFGLGFKYRF